MRPGAATAHACMRAQWAVLQGMYAGSTGHGGARCPLALESPSNPSISDPSISNPSISNPSILVPLSAGTSWALVTLSPSSPTSTPSRLALESPVAAREPWRPRAFFAPKPWHFVRPGDPAPWRCVRPGPHGSLSPGNAQSV